MGIVFTSVWHGMPGRGNAFCKPSSEAPHTCFPAQLNTFISAVGWAAPWHNWHLQDPLGCCCCESERADMEEGTLRPWGSVYDCAKMFAQTQGGLVRRWPQPRSPDSQGRGYTQASWFCPGSHCQLHAMLSFGVFLSSWLQGDEELLFLLHS